MVDLHNILNKFNNLGIVNKGLTVDAPSISSKKESNEEINPNNHARRVDESIGNKFIPGVSDTSASDFAALAGVKKPAATSMYTDTPKPRPQPTNPNPSSTSNTNDWNTVLDRLSNMESKLNKLFETLNPAPWKEKLNESLQEGDLIIKRPAFNHAMQSAMDDLLSKTTKNPEMIPLVQKLYKMATGKDVEYDDKKDSFTIKAPAKELSPVEKIIAKSKQQLKSVEDRTESLQSEFASFLKELENSKK